jgi:hypothetical protein
VLFDIPNMPGALTTTTMFSTIDQQSFFLAHNTTTTPSLPHLWASKHEIGHHFLNGFITCRTFPSLPHVII